MYLFIYIYIYIYIYFIHIYIALTYTLHSFHTVELSILCSFLCLDVKLKILNHFFDS